MFSLDPAELSGALRRFGWRIEFKFLFYFPFRVKPSRFSNYCYGEAIRRNLICIMAIGTTSQICDIDFKWVIYPIKCLSE